MSIVNLSKIKKIFGSATDSQEDEELFKEMLILTLSRATRADLGTDEAEVIKVQEIMRSTFGVDISAKDIRVAASSELYESAPLKKYLSRLSPRIDSPKRQIIVKSLVDVFKADGRLSASEAEFFNMVADALRLTPAEIAGLE